MSDEEKYHTYGGYVKGDQFSTRTRDTRYPGSDFWNDARDWTYMWETDPGHHVFALDRDNYPLGMAVRENGFTYPEGTLNSPIITSILPKND